MSIQQYKWREYMSYQTTKEHELLREKVREFAEREIKPVAFSREEHGKTWHYGTAI